MLSKNKIQLIIGLMSVAFIGLLLFQGYWISNVLGLQNEQFDLKVSDALQDVVRKLEKQEIIFLAQQQAKVEEQQRKIESLGKSKIKVQNPQTQAAPEYYFSASVPAELWQHDVNVSDIFVPENHGMIDRQKNDIRAALRSRFLENPELENLLRIHEAQEKEIESWIQQLAEPLQKKQTNLERLPKKDILKDVFKALMFGNRPIEKRINGQLLDSLLKKALEERSINIPYQYAVRQSKNNMPVFSSVVFRPDTVRSTVFSATLFPNEINLSPNLLSIYFPERQQFILNNIGFTLGSSALLLLLMLGCFYVAVSTILKQKKLSDIKNDFINNMTHEFKTPISTIALATDMATQQSDGQRLSRYLNIIKKENQRLGGHVEQILQMAMLERGAIKLEKTELHLHDLIEKVAGTMAVQIEQNGGELLLNLEAKNDKIMADETHLSNVFFNLLDNAIKYSPEELSIKINSQIVDNQLKIVVSDKGLGMSKEQQARIFEQFYRIPTGNVHDVKGFGLGLSYVKKIVETHNGTIDVQSKRGEGSSFEINLPI